MPVDTAYCMCDLLSMALGAPKELSALRRFFLEPRLPKHRQYEALRAYLVEGRPAPEVARCFGYSLNSFHVLCHHFRRGPRRPLRAAAGRRRPPSARLLDARLSGVDLDRDPGFRT